MDRWLGITRYTMRSLVPHPVHASTSIPHLSKAAVRAEALNVLSIDESRGKGGKADRSDEFDPQLQQISALLKPKLEGIEDSANEIGFVTYQVCYASVWVCQRRRWI